LTMLRTKAVERYLPNRGSCARPDSENGFPARLQSYMLWLHSGDVAGEQEERAMVQFTVNPNRHDPYKQFKFRVRMEGRIVAGVAKVGALRRSTEVIEHREGGDPSTSRKSPGRTQFQAVVLARGLKLKPEVIFAGATPSVAALQRETRSVPIVFAEY